jgi:hypothetical protein
VESLQENTERIAEVAEYQAKLRLDPLYGYKDKNELELARRRIVFAENPDAEKAYLVYSVRWDNAFGAQERYDTALFERYTDAMHEFIRREAMQLSFIDAERSNSKLPFQTLTADACIPNGLGESLAGKLIVISPGVLAPEYRSAEYQYAVCTGGFGAEPESRGSAVFVKNLYSGKASRYERRDVLGVADEAKLPEWAKEKLSATRSVEKTAPAKEHKTEKKPSLLGRLESAKSAAAKENEARPVPNKKRNDMEVT